MDEHEFALCVGRLRSRLYRTAYMYLGAQADALEAVDEAVYKALRSLKKLKQPEYFDTWLTRILINECKTELKRRSRVSPLGELPETAVEQFDALPLKDAVARLPRELKEPIILRYFAQYTVAETAAALKIPQGTAATRLRRALSILRLELSEEDILNEQK